MILIPSTLSAALKAAVNSPIDLYELYLDGQTYYFSTETITWAGHVYAGKVMARSAIRRSMDGSFDDVEVTFSNVDRAIAQLILPNNIEGRRLVVRKIDRTVAGESVVLFCGEMTPPGKIDEDTAVISARHVLGSIDFDAPTRTFAESCQFPFKGWECGYAGAEAACNHSWADCRARANTARFGGFRFVPSEGQANLTIPLLGNGVFVKKWKRYDTTAYETPIPVVYGAVQMAALVIQYEIVASPAGTVAFVVAAFSVGPVRAIWGVTINGAAVEAGVRLGELGGVGSQVPNPLLSSGYPYSLVACIDATCGADIENAAEPQVAGTVLGRLVKRFDQSGDYVDTVWSDNPIWCVRDFMTLPLAQGGLGIPEEMMDDAQHWVEAQYCDELIEDRTNDQVIYNPTNATPGTDAPRVYRSTGVSDRVPFSWDNDGPYIDHTPTEDDTAEPVPVMIKRFTCNVAITDKDEASNILFSKLFPAFRGYLAQTADGKLQIRVERPVKNDVTTQPAYVGSTALFCEGTWAAGEWVLIEPLTGRAEVRRISEIVESQIHFSPALTWAHAAGSTLMQVAAAFDDSNLIGKPQFPLTADKQSATNRIAVKYTDAPAGFQKRELRVNDYAHQALVHKINSEDVDGSAIDSYFQAWRIGEWIRAKRRDLGEYCQITADVGATGLEIGDVFCLTSAEHGLQAVAFLVMEISYQENDEIEIVGQAYALSVYDDQAPQRTVTIPTIFTPGAPSATTRIESGRRRIRLALAGARLRTVLMKDADGPLTMETPTEGAEGQAFTVFIQQGTIARKIIWETGWQGVDSDTVPVRPNIYAALQFQIWGGKPTLIQAWSGAIADPE